VQIAIFSEYNEVPDTSSTLFAELFVIRQMIFGHVEDIALCPNGAFDLSGAGLSAVGS